MKITYKDKRSLKRIIMSKNSEVGIIHYRGWVIRPKKGKFEVAYERFSNSPVMIDTIQEAKDDINMIESGKEYARKK